LGSAANWLDSLLTLGIGNADLVATEINEVDFSSCSQPVIKVARAFRA
jgi:hypothetical protein